MFLARLGEARLEEASGVGSRHDGIVRGDVIVMGVRDEGERLADRGVEPEAMGGELDAAKIANGNHCFGKKKRGGVKE